MVIELYIHQYPDFRWVALLFWVIALRLYYQKVWLMLIQIQLSRMLGDSWGWICFMSPSTAINPSLSSKTCGTHKSSSHSADWLSSMITHRAHLEGMTGFPRRVFATIATVVTSKPFVGISNLLSPLLTYKVWMGFRSSTSSGTTLW